MILLFAYPLLLAFWSSIYLALAIQTARSRLYGKSVFYSFATCLSMLLCLLVFCPPDPRVPLQELIPPFTVNFGFVCAIRFSKLRLRTLTRLGWVALVVLVNILWCIGAYPPSHTFTQQMAPSPDGRYVACMLQCDESGRRYSAIAIGVRNGNGSLGMAQEVARGSDPSYELTWRGNQTLRIREFALDHSNISTLTRLRSNWRGIHIDLERHSPGQAINESTPLP